MARETEKLPLFQFKYRYSYTIFQLMLKSLSALKVEEVRACILSLNGPQLQSVGV